MGLPFMKSGGRRRDQVVAIDVGGRTTKAVHLQRRDESFHLLDYALVETPGGEKALTSSGLSEHLKNVARSLGCGKGKPITLSIGVADVLFRQVEIPLMPAADVRLMLKYNSKNYLQQDLPDHVFDCCFAAISPTTASKAAEASKSGGGAPKHKAIVGGAKRQFVEDLQSAIKAAGLLPDQIVPGLIGPINAFELGEPEVFSREVAALVDIGFKTSTINILDCGEIILNRVVNVGGDHLTAGVAEMLGLAYDAAEKLKIEGTPEASQHLDHFLQPLGRELRASIDFFENQRDKTVAHVFVSGGSARSDVILEVLQNQLMVPCKRWNPAKSIQMELPPEKMGDIEQVLPQLTVAFGAASTGF